MGVLGEVEGGGLNPQVGSLLSIVAHAATDGKGRLSRRLLRMRVPKIKQERIGTQIGPGNGALSCFPFLVKSFEPSGGVALAMEFRGEFAGTGAVFHLARF